MAALESQAVTTDQGDSSICVCAALAMAATEGGLLTISSFVSQFKIEKLSFAALDDVGIDASQRELQSHLVNTSVRVRKKAKKRHHK